VTEVFKQAAVETVRTGLSDHVDHATRRAPEFGIGAAGDDLELLYCFQRDVNRRALSACLLAEEPVVVVAAVQRDVVENAALSVDVDFVAVRTLRDADARRQREQIFKLAPQDRRIGYR